jgi:uncharacterized membrane protein (GlpM family)
MMQTIVKLGISLTIILVCTQIGRRFPSLAGLIAVMPLTGVIVLVWLHSENGGNPEVMIDYAKGALLGILPSILFFVMAFLCFKKHLALPIVLSASFAVWLVAAVLHQWFFRL